MENLTFNWDVLKILVIGVVLLLVLNYVVSKIWKIIDKDSFNESEKVYNKVWSIFLILSITALLLFTVFNGYESTHVPDDMGAEVTKTEAKKFVEPTLEEIEADQREREAKRIAEEEAKIKKEKEESKRAYEEALNN